MTTNPLLETPRLILRPPIAADFDGYVELMRNNAVKKIRQIYLDELIILLASWQ